MSDFNSLVQYTVENISRPIKYIIYKLTEFIRVVDKFVFRQVPTDAASGYATIEKIEGNTVKFNQSASFNNSSETKYGLNITVSDDVVTITGTAESTFPSSGYYEFTTNIYTLIAQHKYLTQLVPIRWNVTNNAFIFFRGFPNAYAKGLKDTQTQVILTASSAENKVRIYTTATTQIDIQFRLQLIDLTAIFGSDNEPTTVAEFEAWRDANGLPSVAIYNPGELISCKMSGMQTEDSSQQTLDTLPFDVTTITGINTSTNVRETIFPNGMKQSDRAGTVKDTLDLLSDTATVNVGSRAYQSGDESDTTVITDGTTTYYALTTPIEYTDLQDANGNPLNPRYKVEQGGTEQVLPTNTSTPTTVAPTLTTTYTKDNN